MSDLRNFVMDEYVGVDHPIIFRVDHPIIWDIIANKLDPLAEACRQSLKESLSYVH